MKKRLVRIFYLNNVEVFKEYQLDVRKSLLGAKEFMKTLFPDLIFARSYEGGFNQSGTHCYWFWTEGSRFYTPTSEETFHAYTVKAEHKKFMKDRTKGV